MQTLSQSIEITGDLEFGAWFTGHHGIPQQPPTAECLLLPYKPNSLFILEVVWCDGKNMCVGTKKPEFEAWICQYDPSILRQ